MSLLNFEPKRVFHYFSEISAIPRGSGNMHSIADYCVKFADMHSLSSIRDESNNVIIFKPASLGYESAEPIILQGHLDIVCQKVEDSKINFLKDGIEIYDEDDFVKANGTTLGADNGIAIAMILAILEDRNLSHPPIEAVLTTDEEIGLLGAIALDTKCLKGKKMINLDSEDESTLFVSCAGGRERNAVIPINRENVTGTEITVTLSGLKGGHSGVEIDKGRVNANILAARFLNHINNKINFDFISIDGGNKSNAITNHSKIKLCVKNIKKFYDISNECLSIIKTEISEREPEFSYEIKIGDNDTFKVFSPDLKDKLINLLISIPNGVVDMSAEINGLVETSLNCGIINTNEESILINISIRSNKKTAMDYIEEKLDTIFKIIPCSIESFGYYPAWEFKSVSNLRELYKETYKELFGFEPKVAAIHAGLECGIFSSKIDNLDCIAIGPDLFDVHTVNEKLSISSTERLYKLLLKILEKSK